MLSRFRVMILLLAIVPVVGVAAPPVFEDHAEAGFCSADCPVQHDGHGIAVTSPLAPNASCGALVVLGVPERDVDADIRPVTGPAAPRAPPSV